MSERTYAGFMAALLVVPVAALCCLGPIVLVSFLAGAFGSLSGLTIAETVGVVIAAGALAYVVRRWWTWRLSRPGVSAPNDLR